jgi:hypothetical protein
MTLVLLGGMTPLRSQDRVLVPGDPALTQDLVEKRLKYLEWLLDTRFTARQRSDYQRLFTQAWRNAQPAQRRHWDDYMTRDAERVDQLGPEESVQQRRATLPLLVTSWEKSTYPGERWALQQYRLLYQPGGPNNPIRVAGDPPLTQQFLDVETDHAEVVLDLRMTAKQREEYQQLVQDQWKAKDKEQKVQWVKGNKQWGARLPTYRPHGRHLTRALNLPRWQKVWAESPDDPQCRWCSALYESTFKPGSARNPVLVDGTPELTQLLVDRHGDYLEVMLDLSTSGGFTTAQRQVLQDYLVKDWKRMSDEERAGLLGDLKRWEDAAGKGIEPAKQSISALRPKLLAQLSTARSDARSQWLLEIAVAERRKAEQVAKDQQMMFDAMRFIIRKMEDGHWENRGNGRLEWVPGR